LKQDTYSMNYEERKNVYREVREGFFRPGLVSMKPEAGDVILLTHRGENDAVGAVGTFVDSEPVEEKSTGPVYLVDWTFEVVKLDKSDFDCYQGGRINELHKSEILEQFDIQYIPNSAKTKKRTKRAKRAVTKTEKRAAVSSAKNKAVSAARARALAEMPAWLRALAPENS